MADRERPLLSSNDINELWIDMGDGTFAVRIAADALVGGAPINNTTNQLPVIAAGRTPRVTASFDMPGQSGAFQSKDIIANSMTAGSVVPMEFEIGRSSGRITGARAVVSAASGNLVTTALTFALILYRPAANIPYAAGGYPATNAPFVETAAAMRQRVGTFLFSADTAWTTEAGAGYQSTALNSTRPFAPFNLVELSATKLIGVVAAQGAWTPGNIVNTFDFMLDVDAD